MKSQGLKVYRRNRQLRAAPARLQQEGRPILDEMAQVSRQAALNLPLDEAMIDSAVRATFNLLREKEIHTELIGGRWSVSGYDGTSGVMDKSIH
ncbi:hypothetical protein AGMMS50256_28950 [Betaproteobacteria bacterium]|nr:hypothetical protein AGMMS50256_28950 [Betaproteobacteria bacterium]